MECPPEALPIGLERKVYGQWLLCWIKVFSCTFVFKLKPDVVGKHITVFIGIGGLEVAYLRIELLDWSLTKVSPFTAIYS